LTKSVYTVFGVYPGQMDRLLGVFLSFIALKTHISGSEHKQNLKIAEHVDIHVLHLPTKF